MKYFILVILFLHSCSNLKNQDSSNQYDITKVDWKGIDTNKLPLKFGDKIEFNVENEKIQGIVLDFNKDEDGIWYGICFLNDNKLFGRLIPDGTRNFECGENMYDLFNLNEKALKNYKIIYHYNVDKEKIRIGGGFPSDNFYDLKLAHNQGINKRKLKMTPCKESLFDINAIHECYFDLKTILK